MSRWKELPETLDPQSRQLAVQLRRLKDHSGLSLAGLASKTAYSKSSWERYLNGKKLPPRDAVEALARVTGAPPARLVALLDVAGTRGGQPAGASEGAVSGGAVSGGAPAPPRPLPNTRSGTRRWWLAAAVALILPAGGGLLAVAPWDSGPGPDPRVTAHRHGEQWRQGRDYGCDIREDGGRTYAGHSVTGQAVLEYSVTGWDVVEAQCLVRRAGYDPGVVDGIYGDNTGRAVKRLQKRAGIADDGEVGPDTWRVLRR